jgi:hypothetical protein
MVAPACGDVDRDVSDDSDAARGRVRAERAPLAVEAHLVGDRIVAGERLPVAEPASRTLREVAHVARRNRCVGVREQAGPARERRRGRVRRPERVRRIEREHLPPPGPGRREPVDERVGLRPQAALRERRRVELDAE